MSRSGIAHSVRYSPPCTLFIPYSFATPFNPTLYTLHPIPYHYTPHPTPYLQPTRYTLHPKPCHYTLHPTPYLHSVLCTRRAAPSEISVDLRAQTSGPPTPRREVKEAPEAKLLDGSMTISGQTTVGVLCPLVGPAAPLVGRSFLSW